MNIFIDESGKATAPAVGERNLFCVGALVVPEATLPELTEQFAALKSKWGVPAGEVKGCKLKDPQQIVAVIDLLIQCRCLFFVAATEMSVNEEAEMKTYQKVQTEYFTDGLTEGTHPLLRKQVTEIRATFEEKPRQLFIQDVLLSDLLKKVIDLATLHFALTSPVEAGRFNWVIDGKNITKDKYEAAWEAIVGAMIQGRCLDSRGNSRGFMAEEGDYSHFSRFLTDKWPAHLPPPNPENPTQSGVILDLSKILHESMTFADSKASVGLQLADIVTNAFRRAMMGYLPVDAYDHMGELMVGLNNSPFQLHLFTSSAKQPSLDDYTNACHAIKSRSRWPGFR